VREGTGGIAGESVVLGCGNAAEACEEGVKSIVLV
jgi:hypothetical protein